MAEWSMRPVAMSVVEAGTNQPTVACSARIGEHRIWFETTAKGFFELTKRRHPRVKAMHAAYRRRSK